MSVSQSAADTLAAVQEAITWAWFCIETTEQSARDSATNAMLDKRVGDAVAKARLRNDEFGWNVRRDDRRSPVAVALAEACAVLSDPTSTATDVPLVLFAFQEAYAAVARTVKKEVVRKNSFLAVIALAAFYNNRVTPSVRAIILFGRREHEAWAESVLTWLGPPHDGEVFAARSVWTDAAGLNRSIMIRHARYVTPVSLRAVAPEFIL